MKSCVVRQQALLGKVQTICDIWGWTSVFSASLKSSVNLVTDELCWSTTESNLPCHALQVRIATVLSSPAGLQLLCIQHWHFVGGETKTKTIWTEVMMRFNWWVRLNSFEHRGLGICISAQLISMADGSFLLTLH